MVDEVEVVAALVIIVIKLEVVELLVKVVAVELDIDELLLEEVEETLEEAVLGVEVVIVDKVVEIVLEDESVEVVLEDELVEVVLADEVVDELAARLLYICKALEPPQHSSAFTLQVMIQAVDPTTLAALGELPQ